MLGRISKSAFIIMDSKDLLKIAGPPRPSKRVFIGPITRRNQERQESDHNNRLEQAEIRTELANSRTQLAEARTEQANTRTDEANTRTDEANTRTEQAEARSVEAILASETRYRRLFETAQNGILILDADTGQVVDANPFMKDLLGYSQEEFLGRKLWEIGPFKGEAASKIAFAELQQADRIRYEGLPLETKDGHRVEVEFISNAYLVDEKRLIQCNIHDITEQKKNELQLLWKTAFFEAQIHSALDGILVVDSAGRKILQNQRMIDLWNIPLEFANDVDDQLQLKWVIDQTKHPKEFAAKVQHLYSHPDEIGRDELELLNGNVFDRYSAPVRGKDGTDYGRIWAFRDITERKKLEQQFFRAQRMESIGTLAGGIAHDLNNILAPIVMSIDLLKGMSDDPQAKSILETIEVSAKRGTDIVRQVLSFARGVEGERVEVQPVLLLKDLENIIKDTFPKNIHLQFSVSADVWSVVGDPTQVHQILLNLSVNARDAMPDGGNLTISAENCVLDEKDVGANLNAKAGRYVRISVIDSGKGIAPELLGKIFDPFFTTKELHEGTGLGLSTVMAIVKSHDGIINVYSEPRKGTKFKIYLPAKELSSEARQEQTEQASLPRGNGEKILIVDDEAAILSITSQTLQTYGYRVLTAVDGAEAVALYAQHRNEIAVVLTDMSMPIMDGAAAIRALMRINPTVKVIAASGLDANGSAAKGAGPGVKHFLTKPYSAGTLLTLIRTILDQA